MSTVLVYNKASHFLNAELLLCFHQVSKRNFQIEIPINIRFPPSSHHVQECTEIWFP